ncbi:MAG: aminoglycoside phosphotransferase family protein [Candidatus Heimdallarchaeota archaeon]
MDITESQVKEICKKCSYDFISFQLLGTGAFNINYLLETKQGKFVLKIENNNQYQNYKKHEYEILKSLDGKFGPKVYFFDDSKKIIPTDYLIEELIDFGVHPPAEASDEFIETMGKWFRRLHRIKTKIDESSYDIKHSFYYNYKKYYKNKQVLEKEYLEIIEKLFEEGSKIIEKNNIIFSRRKYHSLIHGDPFRTNIFYSKKLVKLVDWEFSHYQIRERELASFVWYFDLDLKRKLAFLKHAGYPLTDFGRKQFETVYLIRCIDMLVWRVERLRMIKEGKVERILTDSDFEEAKDGLKDDIQRFKIALENPFL